MKINNRKTYALAMSMLVLTASASCGSSVGQAGGSSSETVQQMESQSEETAAASGEADTADETEA